MFPACGSTYDASLRGNFPEKSGMIPDRQIAAKHVKVSAITSFPTVSYSKRMDMSLKRLEEALSVRRQIDVLERRLASLFGTASPRSTSRTGKRTMSPQARAKIAAAMRARWAKRKRTSVSAATRKKGGLTPAGRQRLSQLMKARWAARKKASRQK